MKTIALKLYSLKDPAKTWVYHKVQEELFKLGFFWSLKAGEQETKTDGNVAWLYLNYPDSDFPVLPMELLYSLSRQHSLDPSRTLYFDAATELPGFFAEARKLIEFPCVIDGVEVVISSTGININPSHLLKQVESKAKEIQKLRFNL